jgi:hypothetical protein
MAVYSIGSNEEVGTGVKARMSAARKKRDEARAKAEGAIEEAEGLAGGGALAIEEGAAEGRRALRGATGKAVAAAGGDLASALSAGKERGLAEAQFDANTAERVQKAKEDAALNKLELARARREMDEGSEMKENLREVEQAIADAISAATGFWGLDEKKARELAQLEIDKLGDDRESVRHAEKFLESGMA